MITAYPTYTISLEGWGLPCWLLIPSYPSFTIHFGKSGRRAVGWQGAIREDPGDTGHRAPLISTTPCVENRLHLLPFLT